MELYLHKPTYDFYLKSDVYKLDETAFFLARKDAISPASPKYPSFHHNFDEVP